MSPPRVVKLTPEVGERVRAHLEALDYSFSSVPHAAWSARGEGAVVTLYKSGKLVVAGKGAEDFVAGRLGWEEDETPGTVVKSRIIGTDEAGKGDYFGPLVTAAVLVDPKTAEALTRAGVRDSKDLADTAAKKTAAIIRKTAPHAVVAIGPIRYNELRESKPNLNHLLAWCHATAVAEITETDEADEIISDQFGAASLLKNAYALAGVELPLTQRHRAESHVAVAAASILARAAFLDGLARLGDEVGRKLPKGAGAQVDEAGRALVAEQGRDVLGRVAKLHFKNTSKVLEYLF
jgi:ribonuclease HIII